MKHTRGLFVTLLIAVSLLVGVAPTSAGVVCASKPA